MTPLRRTPCLSTPCIPAEPAFGATVRRDRYTGATTIDADQSRMLVSVVKSRNGGRDVTTGNFSSATVERTGR